MKSKFLSFPIDFGEYTRCLTLLIRSKDRTYWDITDFLTFMGYALCAFPALSALAHMGLSAPSWKIVSGIFLAAFPGMVFIAFLNVLKNYHEKMLLKPFRTILPLQVELTNNEIRYRYRDTNMTGKMVFNRMRFENISYVEADTELRFIRITGKATQEIWDKDISEDSTQSDFESATGKTEGSFLVPMCLEDSKSVESVFSILADNGVPVIYRKLFRA